jgi:hypothetical protein
LIQTTGIDHQADDQGSEKEANERSPPMLIVPDLLDNRVQPSHLHLLHSRLFLNVV